MSAISLCAMLPYGGLFLVVSMAEKVIGLLPQKKAWRLGRGCCRSLDLVVAVRVSVDVLATHDDFEADLSRKAADTPPLPRSAFAWRSCNERPSRPDLDADRHPFCNIPEDAPFADNLKLGLFSPLPWYRRQKSKTSRRRYRLKLGAETEMRSL